MKDKIISFILILLTVAILGAIAIFGYVAYLEITGNDITSIDFVGYGDILGIGKDKKEEDNIDTSVDIFNGVDDNKTSAETITTNDNRYRHLYEQLDDTAKKIYDKLYENRENMKTGTYRIDFGNAFQNLLSQADGESELKKEYQSAIETLIYENPEIFYLDATSMYINIEKVIKITSTKYNVYIDNGSKPNYLAEGFNSKEDIEAYQAKIERVRDYIVENIKDKSDYEKIKLTHNYLRDTINYESTISKNNIYDIYGALVLRECVCEGYAKAFQYIMNEVGIDNVIVIGTGTNSMGKTENHAWNYVKLDKKWYAVDVTWDDPMLIGDGIIPEKSKYKYFLKGSKTMNENHFISGKFTDGGQTFTYPTLSVEDYE